MWFKVDDQLAFHPKAFTVGNTALGLWVRAGSWSGAQLTDGHIPDHVIKALGGTRADTTRLVQSGLWEKVPGGYQFHDWEQYQPASKDVRTKRTQARNRMRELRANQTQTNPEHP